MLNSNLSDTIQSFAKENKISQEKLKTFIEKILSENPSHVGREAKESTKELRDRFKNEYKKLPALTSEHVSNYFGVSKTDANNCLNYYGRTGLIKKGEPIKVAGKRGRAAIMWVSC